jgi:hypothetical protein
MEFRHESWLGDAKIERLLRDNNVALVGGDEEDGTSLLVSTADWGYLRFRRDDYDESELRARATSVIAQDWRRAFVFFKHEEDGAGPPLARAFLDAATAKPVRKQAPTTPMTPSAPHEALSFFEGSWTVAERPAEQQLVEICSWLNAGRRHMVCRATWQAATGPREGVSIFSYRAADSTYLYYGIRPSGAVEALEGRGIEDGFQFTGESGSGPERVRTRVTVTRTGPRGFRFLAESSRGDGPWEVAGTEHYVPAPGVR